MTKPLRIPLGPQIIHSFCLTGQISFFRKRVVEPAAYVVDLKLSIVYSTRALAPANGHALGTRLACIILQTDDVSCSILDLSSSFSLFLTISMGIYAKTYCKKKSLRPESSPNLVQSSVYAICHKN